MSKTFMEDWKWHVQEIAAVVLLTAAVLMKRKDRFSKM